MFRNPYWKEYTWQEKATRIARVVILVVILSGLFVFFGGSRILRTVQLRNRTDITPLAALSIEDVEDFRYNVIEAMFSEHFLSHSWDVDDRPYHLVISLEGWPPHFERGAFEIMFFSLKHPNKLRNIRRR